MTIGGFAHLRLVGGVGASGEPLWFAWSLALCHDLPHNRAVRAVLAGSRLTQRARSCELFSPYRGPGPGSLRGGNPRKMGKLDKNSASPTPTPEIGEKLPKNDQKLYFRSHCSSLRVQLFPIFRGQDWEGIFGNSSPFFGDFRPGGFPASARGKNNSARQESSDELELVCVVDLGLGLFVLV